jgi:hypothetical protein
LNLFRDLDEEISKLIKPESRPSPDSHTPVPSSLPERELTSARPADAKQIEPDPESKWTSHMQLITFRATAGKIADEYLKGKGVKLYGRSARSRKIQDLNAYNQGVKDSKKIDVHGKIIE